MFDRLMRFVVVTSLVLLVPALAYAQASITGVVRDTSGAVMPGVTVEAASPALIEKVRTALTDGSGQFRITDLRPGPYVLTFTLAGFNAVRREGIELSGSFVATVNAEMRVGELSETITVTGESPMVDLQTATQQRVISQEIITEVPTSRTYATLAALLPGMTYSVGAGSLAADVGGSSGESAAVMSIHGGSGNDSRIQMNGLDTGMADHPHRNTTNPAMASVQEIAIDTSAIDASGSTGGVRVNFIPKDGGNTFQGTMHFTGANGSFASDNFTQELRDRGATAANPLKRTMEINPGFGGPIKRDKLWFFGYYRYQVSEVYLAGLFQNKNLADPTKWTYEPNPTNQIFNQTEGSSGGLRLTWQVTPRNKVAFFHESRHQCYCPDQSPTQAREASSDTVQPHSMNTQVDWSAPLTNRLLLQASLITKPDRYGFRPTADYDPRLIGVTEQNPVGTAVTSYRGRGSHSWEINPITRWTTSLAYVTGAHAFKVGWNDAYSARRTETTSDWPYTYTLNRGMPVAITMSSFPVIARGTLRSDGGVYVQDRWTLNRLTLSGGLRFDYYESYAPEQTVGPAPLTPNRNITFPETPLRSYKDLVPRVSAVYDLFGNGKTAVKTSLSKYVNTVLVRGDAASPVGLLQTTASRAWTDGNRNFHPDCDLTSPALQDRLSDGGDLCGPLTGTNAFFGGTRPASAVDPETLSGWGRRGYNWEFTAGVQHELMPRVGLDVGYFRRSIGNQLLTVNRAVTEADYGAFCVTAPLDTRLPDGGGNAICGFRNINPDATNKTDNYQTFAKDYADQVDITHSVDVSVNTRLRAVTVQGGTSSSRRATDQCELLAIVPSAGNLAFCDAPGKFITQVKGLAAYTIPRVDVLLSATWQSVPGPARSASVVYPSAVIAPSLGRPLSGNAANVTLNVLEPRTLFGDRANQVDVRFGKLLRVGATQRFQINLDLYNMFNASPVLSESGAYSALWTPTAVLPARLLKFGVQYDF